MHYARRYSGVGTWKSVALVVGVQKCDGRAVRVALCILSGNQRIGLIDRAKGECSGALHCGGAAPHSPKPPATITQAHSRPADLRFDPSAHHVCDGAFGATITLPSPRAVCALVCNWYSEPLHLAGTTNIWVRSSDCEVA